MEEVQLIRRNKQLVSGKHHGIRLAAPTTNYRYPAGHPCHGCPFTFPTPTPSCTMGGGPTDCPWAFYKKMQGR